MGQQQSFPDHGRCPPFGRHTVMSQPPDTDRAGPHPHLLSCDQASATDAGPGERGAAEPLWRLSLFAFERRAVGDATAAALPPASDAPAADIRDPDSNADSSTARQKFDHSLAADKRVAESDSKSFPAAMTVTRCYAASVPREVLLPSGPPDRLCKSRSGTSFEASHIRQPRPPEILSQTAGHRQSFPPSTQPQRIGRDAFCSSVTQFQRDQKTGKETQKETQVFKTLRRKQSQKGDAGSKQTLR